MSTDHTDVIASETYPVTMAAIVRYAGASGDFTPIHYDPQDLADGGYDRFFAMGMLVAGRLGALVAHTFGDGSVRHFDVRFRQRSWVGTDVTVALRHGHTPGVIELLATTTEGEVIGTGSAMVAIDGKGSGAITP